MSYDIKLFTRSINRILLLVFAVLILPLIHSLYGGVSSDPGFSAFPLFPIGYSYWPLAEYGYGYLLDHEVKAIVLILFSLYCLMSAAVGNFFIVRYVNGAEKMPPAPRFLSGFLPGYLMVIAVNRLVTFFLSNENAIFALFGIYSLTISALILSAIKSHSPHSFLRLSHIIGAVICAIVAVFFLCFQIQFGYFHVVADGAGVFLDLMKKKEAFAPAYMFPLFSQHYDEVMFLYPIVQMYDRMEWFNPLEIYWILYSLGKLSALCAAYVCVERMTKSWIPAVISVMLIFFGGLHPDPFSKFLIFDSDNPIAFSVHIARVFLSITPIIMAYFFTEKFKKPIQKDCLTMVVLLLLGIGVSSMTASSLYIIMFSALLFAAAKMYITYKASVGIACACCLAVFVSYFWGAGNNIGIWAMPLSLCAIVVFSLADVKSGANIKLNILGFLSEARFVAIFFLGLALGLIFLGNLLVIKSYSLTGLPHSEIVTRGLFPTGLKVGGNLFCGNYPLTHCLSISNFFSHLGLPFILSIVVLIFASQLKAKVELPTILSPMIRMMLCSLVVVVIALYFYDFMNGEATRWIGIWLKSRLIEPWFYATVVFSICSLWLIGGDARNVTMLIGIIYIIFHNIYFLSGGTIGTVVRNAGYLFNKAFQ